MSSNSIRGIRRKKSSLSEVKLAVLGAPGVGKSALIVRFLTKRYIGEYDHHNDNTYKSEILVDGDPIIFEIADTCQRNGEMFPREDLVHWADGFLLVYSITDRNSFDIVKKLRQYIHEKRKVPGDGKSQQSNSSNNSNNCNNGGINNNFLTVSTPSAVAGTPNNIQSPLIPVIFVANKADLLHSRQVSTEEGEILAKDTDDLFAEVAASDHVSQVADIFHELCREFHSIKRRSKTSIFDRVLGNSKGTSKPENSKK